MNQSYREQFESPQAAAAYDQVQYEAKSYDTLLWQLEQAQLRELVRTFRQSHARIDYLDFACGTGRVLAFLEPEVDTATGIEVSPSMAQRARAHVRDATVHCADITAPHARVDQQYDLITAFRFILNAEPDLRLAGLKAMRERLKDASSRVIFNNHGNPLSCKAPLWPYHRLRRIGARGHPTSGNYLTNPAVFRLAHQAGLKIERTLGVGLIGGKLARFTPQAMLGPMERAAAASRILRPMLVNQLYIARRAD